MSSDNTGNNSPFSYREVYLPESTGKNAAKLGLNSIDQSWGIWGHNLHDVLPEKPSEGIYAKVNGNTIKKQYCFSSQRLFDYITDYIDDRYDSDESAFFSIIPNDNDVVCLCIRCTQAGNSHGDASPAVFNMVRKLATYYPNHVFFTSDYRTTRGLPEEALPKNAGVMVSAMPYPFTLAKTPEEQNFINTLNNWSRKTDRIMVWDYINNFDDYFTPYPIFGVMQSRLKNYRDNNVTAVFMNGSGTDASSFSKLKSVVLAELLKNPDADWREIVRTKSKEIYPKAGETIADFIIAQEDYVEKNNVSLPMYEGVPVALKTYLPKDLFEPFYRKLATQRALATGEEHRDLDILLAELALTQLEINRITGQLRDSEDLLRQLEHLQAENIEAYSESGWRIDNYVTDYRYLLRHANETNEHNKLRGVSLVALTPLDPEYKDLSVITDGVLSIPSNYHNGLLITSPEDYTQIAIPNPHGAKKLVVWLAYNTGYKIYLPELVTLSGEGMHKEVQTPEYPKDYTGHCKVEFDIPSSVTGNLVLTLYKDPETRSMASEEVEMF